MQNIQEQLVNIIQENKTTFLKCEEIRKAKIREYYFDIIFVIIFILIMCVFFNVTFIIALICIPVGLLHYLIHIIYEYKVEYKKLCTSILAKIFDFDNKLLDSKALDYSVYTESKLFRDFTYFTINNIFEKNTGSLNYKIIEITMFFVQSQIFKGIVLTLPNQTNIKEPIIITTKNNRISSDCHKIKFSHPLYKQYFNIYKANTMFSNNVLFENIPDFFFEYILQLKAVFKCKKIKCAILKDKIVVAIDTNRSIIETASLFKSCFDINSIQQKLIADSKLISQIENAFIKLFKHVF